LLICVAPLLRNPSSAETLPFQLLIQGIGGKVVVQDVQLREISDGLVQILVSRGASISVSDFFDLCETTTQMFFGSDDCNCYLIWGEQRQTFAHPLMASQVQTEMIRIQHI